MITKGKPVLCPLTVVIVAILIAACNGGPSEAEFVAGCMKEGEKGEGIEALRREMGVKSDAFCKCAATEHERLSLSADAQRAMMLDMQGKSQKRRERFPPR